MSALGERLTIRFIEFLIKHIFAVLTVVFVIIGLILFSYLTVLSNQQIHQTAIDNAKSYSQTLSTFRSLYTSEVIAVAEKSGITISHDYKLKPNAIPLPATLSMILGNKLGDQSGNISSKLYSEYPFPWRVEDGGLNDEFSVAAWQALQENPNEPYFRFETIDGHTVLRYATADMMRESCVDCHNTHPDTPKNDWQVGQLRGVLEITTKIDHNIALAGSMIKHTLAIIITILLITLSGISLVVRQLKYRTKQAQLLAKSSSKANKMLAQEISYRQQDHEKLMKVSLTDGLTDVANRRKFDQEFDKEWRRAIRSQTSLALILVDVDDFKAYNDNYGHQQGDSALITIAQLLENDMHRASDLLCRYGGEEFIILLPDTDTIGAMKLAEDLRTHILNHGIKHQFARATDVITVSAGVASVIPNEDIFPQSLIKAADDALYSAKDNGRNCVMSQSSKTTVL